MMMMSVFLKGKKKKNGGGWTCRPAAKFHPPPSRCLLLFEHLANTHVDVVAYLPVQNQIKNLENIQTKF